MTSGSLEKKAPTRWGWVGNHYEATSSGWVAPPHQYLKATLKLDDLCRISDRNETAKWGKPFGALSVLKIPSCCFALRGFREIPLYCNIHVTPQKAL